MNNLFLLTLLFFASAALADDNRRPELSQSPGTGKVRFSLDKSRYYFNLEAPNRFKSGEGETIRLKDPALPVSLRQGEYAADIYFCERASGVCLIDKVGFSHDATKDLEIKVELPIPH
jgi:hypothetical protein